MKTSIHQIIDTLNSLAEVQTQARPKAAYLKASKVAESMKDIHREEIKHAYNKGMRIGFNDCKNNTFLISKTHDEYYEETFEK